MVEQKREEAFSSPNVEIFQTFQKAGIVIPAFSFLQTYESFTRHF